jgi:hypothetical protein
MKFLSHFLSNKISHVGTFNIGVIHISLEGFYMICSTNYLLAYYVDTYFDMLMVLLRKELHKYNFNVSLIL